MRILFVDDDNALQGFLKRALIEAGHTLLSSLTIPRRAYLEATRYDMVILGDVSGVGSPEVLKWLREYGKATPVLVVSREDRWEDKVAGLKAGADDYLSKPFYTEELLARLHAVSRRYA